jgi:hypothetical protein
MNDSKFLTLNWKDLVKGLLVAILGAIVAGVTSALQTNTFDLKAIGMGALVAGLSYITKNLFTNSDGAPLAKERK